MALYWTAVAEEFHDEDGCPGETIVFAVFDDSNGSMHATLTDFEEILAHADDPEIANNIGKVDIIDTPFRVPLLEEELRLLDWLAAHLESIEEALDVLAAWRWSSSWNDLTPEFIVDHAQIRAIKRVTGLPAVGCLLLPFGQVRAVAVNAILSPAGKYDVLRVVALEAGRGEDPYGDEIIMPEYSVLHVDERAFIPDRRTTN